MCPAHRTAALSIGSEAAQQLGPFSTRRYKSAIASYVVLQPYSCYPDSPRVVRHSILSFTPVHPMSLQVRKEFVNAVVREVHSSAIEGGDLGGAGDEFGQALGPFQVVIRYGCCQACKRAGGLRCSEDGAVVGIDPPPPWLAVPRALQSTRV